MNNARRIIVFGAVLFLLTGIVLGVSGLRDHMAPADLAVVLGNQVYLDGTLSLRLQGRLNKAIDLYQKKWVSNVLVSGGRGPGYDEAQSMRAYLVAKGIPEKAILVDSFGKNTFLTALHTAAVVRQDHFKTIIIVSQFYHIPRCRLAMKKVGLRDVYWAHADYYEWRDLYSLAREVIGFYVYALRY